MVNRSLETVISLASGRGMLTMIPRAYAIVILYTIFDLCLSFQAQKLNTAKLMRPYGGKNGGGCRSTSTDLDGSHFDKLWVHEPFTYALRKGILRLLKI